MPVATAATASSVTPSGSGVPAPGRAAVRRAVVGPPPAVPDQQRLAAPARPCPAQRQHQLLHQRAVRQVRARPRLLVGAPRRPRPAAPPRGRSVRTLRASTPAPARGVLGRRDVGPDGQPDPTPARAAQADQHDRLPRPEAEQVRQGAAISPGSGSGTSTAVREGVGPASLAGACVHAATLGAARAARGRRPDLWTAPRLWTRPAPAVGPAVPVCGQSSAVGLDLVGLREQVGERRRVRRRAGAPSGVRGTGVEVHQDEQPVAVLDGADERGDRRLRAVGQG